jgi:flagellar biosynthetic protein FliO
MTNLYIQTVMALTLVIGIIYLLGTFMKKRQGKDGLMKIMGFQSLGPKKGIAMVKVGQEILLVGVTATDIKLLKTFEDNLEEVEREPLPEKTETSTFADISDKLKKLRALKDTVYAIK